MPHSTINVAPASNSSNDNQVIRNSVPANPTGNGLFNEDGQDYLADKSNGNSRLPQAPADNSRRNGSSLASAAQ